MLPRTGQRRTVSIPILNVHLHSHNPAVFRQRERTTRAMEHALADVTKAEHAAQTEIVRHQLADMAVRPRWKNDKKRNGMGLDWTGEVTRWVGGRSV